MLDIGWTELMVTLGLAILLVRPQDIVPLFGKAGLMLRHARAWWHRLHSETEAFLHDAEMQHLREQIEIKADDISIDARSDSERNDAN